MAFYSFMSSIILASAQYATSLRIMDTYLAPTQGQTPYENFVQYLTCAGEAYMLSRVEETSPNKCQKEGWRTRIRMLKDDTFKVIGTYATPMSHNMAPLCVDGQILLVGGQWRNASQFSKFAHYKGIQQVLVPSLVQPLDQIQPTLATTGISFTTDCIEGRKEYRDNCEFDGKISLSRKEGTTYMYVRANIDHGKRWVQVAQSSNHKSWSKFKPIEIQGLDRNMEGTNVYFFNVEDWNSTHKAGIFPAVLNGGGGIFLSFSKDMITWCRPSVIKSLKAVEWNKITESVDFKPKKPKKHNTPERVPEYPVALLNRRLLTMKRKTPFHEAFSISDGPLPQAHRSTESSELSNFVPFGLKIESA